MICTATITTASLRLRESRIMADLLLQGVSADEWKKAEVPPVAVPLPMLDLEPSVVPGVGAS